MQAEEPAKGRKKPEKETEKRLYKAKHRYARCESCSAPRYDEACQPSESSSPGDEHPGWENLAHKSRHYAAGSRVIGAQLFKHGPWGTDSRLAWRNPRWVACAVQPLSNSGC